jgi:DNA polymerase-3 subunit gamma/tau
MSYQVIARKWRPQTFEEVTGQEAITQTLRNAIEFDRLHHAYLFSGARGVGKTTTARLLAKALNCHKSDKPTLTPCLVTDETACASCLEISESRSIDVLEFDAASHTGVDAIRDIILESINVSAARDRCKIFIIDEVHMLSTSSFNALLKTLEEPPPNVVFIMATTELHKVPDTILSRCQEFDFRTIALSKIYDRLKVIAAAEKIDVTDEALREIARSGEGSMRDAQSNFDQVISFSGEKIGVGDVTGALGLASADMLTRITSAISTRNRKEALTVVDELISRGQDLRHFCRDLLAFFRDLLVFKIGGDSETLLDTALLSREEMQTHTSMFSEADLLRFFNSLCETETQLKDATQPRYVLEIGLVKLIEMRRVVAIEDLLERLGKLEIMLAGNTSSGSEAPGGPPDIAAAASAEKKTLKPEEPSSSPAVTPPPEPPPPEAVSEPLSKTAENNITPPAPAADPYLDAPYEPGEEPVEEEPLPDSLTSLEPIPEPVSPGKVQNIVERTSSMPVKLAPISSEDLEHVDDNWLDTAYENRLMWSGDDLATIPGASKIAAALFNGAQTQIAAPAGETSNGSAAGAAPARIDLSFMPSLDAGDEPDTVAPVLPENPTEEQLLAYANSHPVVKRALRIFRGRIVKVEKKS